MLTQEAGLDGGTINGGKMRRNRRGLPALGVGKEIRECWDEGGKKGGVADDSASGRVSIHSVSSAMRSESPHK